MSQITINFYADPGHGWAKVPRKLLHELGIASKVSTCSYERGEYVYLEEDCDASLLVGALRERGTTVKWRESHTNKRSKIRGYSHYRHVAVTTA